MSNNFIIKSFIKTLGRFALTRKIEFLPYIKVLNANRPNISFAIVKRVQSKLAIIIKKLSEAIKQIKRLIKKTCSPVL